MTRIRPEGIPGAGLALVDKAAGWTSHDAVARLRRTLGTRRVGHSGTLDPAATGLLVCGFGSATRLLGHLAVAEKHYEGTIRLGLRTTTDDAAGEAVSGAPPGPLREGRIAAALEEQTGEILQRPSAVSAIKVGGRRAHELVRSGAQVELEPRLVRVRDLRLTAMRVDREGFVDADIEVTCSSGTYVRAIARDVGEALGCGGHITALRRTRVGAFSLDGAGTVDEPTLLTLEEACEIAFRTVVLDEADVMAAGHGRPVEAHPGGPEGLTAADEMIAAFDGDGRLVALLATRADMWLPKIVFRPARGA